MYTKTIIIPLFAMMSLGAMNKGQQEFSANNRLARELRNRQKIKTYKMSPVKNISQKENETFEKKDSCGIQACCVAVLEIIAIASCGHITQEYVGQNDFLE